MSTSLRAPLARTALIAALAWVALPATSAAEPAKPEGTIIEFTVDVSRAAPNDLARASAFMEASDASPADLAKRVNSAISAALNTVKAYSTIKVKSGATYTYPSYAKGGRNIESWRMRSEIQMETRDIGALSELLGKLQANLGVGQIQLVPAPETRKKIEDEATLEALAAFRAKAKLIADAMGKPYRIKQLSVQGSGRPPVVPVMARAAAMTAEAAPTPIEAGESSIGVTVSGQIELPLE